MPRINTRKDARILETIEKDDKYDLNSSFSAEYKEVVFDYNSQDSLVLWSQLCGKDSYTDFIDGLSGGDYVEFATDRSLNGNNNRMFSDPSLLSRRFDEESLSYVLSLPELAPIALEMGITAESIDMCGNPCMFFNMSLAFQTEKACEMVAIGADHFYIPHNSDLTHTTSSGTPADTPFSISLWYYPVDYETNPNKLYDRGGGARLMSPTIFHKTFEYGLFIRECGKLEFVLFDVDIDVTGEERSLNYNASLASLTVRSDENVLKPGYWNHITVTYDGSGSRNGMRIYVNCSDRTNRADDPPATSGARTLSYTGITPGLVDIAHQNFILQAYYAGDQEDVTAYTRMRTHSTPLVFASSAYPNSSQIPNLLSATDSNLMITDAMMQPLPSSQLPLTFLFDFAMWNKELDKKNIIAVCAATRDCAIKYSITSIPSRDSGYISLSPKILSQIRDQKRNELSVIDRVGDRSDRRVKTRPAFDDRNVLIFGQKIVDEFKSKSFEINKESLTDADKKFGVAIGGQIPDERLWEGHNVLVKRELKKIGNETIYTSALSMSGLGVSHIATKEYFYDAIIYYDLILGPYNQKPGLLNLKDPGRGTKLYIEIQEQGTSSWRIVKAHNINSKNNPDYFDEFYSSNFSDGIVLTPNQHQFRRSFSLSVKDFPADRPYKIRFRSLDRSWAIGRIEILGGNQMIRPPLLVGHDSYAGRYIDKKIIATPHTRSDITTLGRTLSGISDTSIYFSDEATQKIKPFKDNLMVPFAAKSFFEVGIDSDVYPGFSSPLKDKTLVTIDLRGENECELGFNNKFEGANTNFLGGDDINGASITNSQILNAQNQPVNLCWHKSFNQLSVTEPFCGWAPINVPAFIALHAGIAYSPIDAVASGSTSNGNPTKVEFYHSDEAFASYAQPVTSTGYPTDSDSFTHGYDECIEMSDYINKPFLLEKVVLEFSSKFDFAKAGTAHAGAVDAYKLMIGHNNTSFHPDQPSRRFLTNNIVIIPSYSLIRVRAPSAKIYTRYLKMTKTNGTHVEYLRAGSTSESTSFDVSGDFPAQFFKNRSTGDYQSGDLITYGQITLFASASHLSSDLIDMDTVLNKGLLRDSFVNINELPGQSENAAAGNIAPFTASFAIETPVRSLPIVSPTQRIYFRDYVSSPNDTFGVFTSNLTGGRSVTQAGSLNRNRLSRKKDQQFSFSNSQRGIVNNFNTIDAKNVKRYKLNTINNFNLPDDVSSSGELLETNSTISPYLLLPEDRIALTFHYPIPQNGYAVTPGSTDTTFNKMKIGKDIKIHMYGSLVKEGKEYHENMNQALTTAQISEPIGCETPVDRFEIATRDEYFKSYVDRLPLMVRQRNRQGVSKTVREIVNVDSDFSEHINITGNLTADHKIPWLHILPDRRIGLPVGSLVHHWVSYQVASSSITQENEDIGASYQHLFIRGFLQHETQAISGSVGRDGAFMRSIIPSGTWSTNSTAFGSQANASRHSGRKSFVAPFTMHNNNQKHYFDSGMNDPGYFDTAKNNFGKTNQRFSREKYIFSHKHFGHRADMLCTSRDSKFKVRNDYNRILYQPDLYSDILSDQIRMLRSPVFVQFASSSKDEKGVITYYATDQTPSSHYQSLNKTKNASITAPFDDGDTIIFT